METRIGSRTLCTLVLYLFAHCAAADQLLLRDGSRIHGEVVKKAGNTLEFKTSFAGTIKVDWDQVSELRTDQPTPVLLSNDEVIQAQVFINSAEGTRVETVADAAPRNFDPAEVAFIKPERWRLGEGFKFSGRANFTLESERGNTDSDEIDIDGNLLWRRKQDRFTMRGEREYDKNDGTTTADSWKLNGKYDYFVTPKRYYSGVLFSEGDDFAELTLRLGGGPAVGYQFFEREELNLSVEAGPMRVYEDFKTQENERYWGAGWLIDFDKYVLPNVFESYHLQFYHRNRGLWNLNDTSDVIWDTWTGLRFPLILGLVGSTELKAEYDSGAAVGADDLDTTFNLKLGYQW
jgi:RNase P/RNase MRP subunit p29